MNKSFGAWAESHKDDCFRYWVHKIMFTPYEEAEKFEDQSCLEDITCSFGYIVDYTVLPDNDILIGFSENKDGGYISYYKLSNIDLAIDKKDAEDDDE